MSFLRHEEIYSPMSSMPGRPQPDRPRPHRFDEFPAGYSLAGCAPAWPASASPAAASCSKTASLYNAIVPDDKRCLDCLSHSGR